MKFTAVPMSLPDVKLIIGEVYTDNRGVFTEAYRESRFKADFDLPPFVQGNVSTSRKGVARGLHYQVVKPQGKLMRTVHGRTLNLAVDVRAGSATFGGWTWTILDAANTALWVPPGFANGFVALDDDTTVAYECSTYHYVGSDRAMNMAMYLSGLRDKANTASLIFSDKDREAPTIDNAEPVPGSEWALAA